MTSSAAPSLSSVYDAETDLRDVVFIAISQSGKSPDLLAAAENARACGALVVALCNTPDAPLMNVAHHGIALHAGSETSVAATKSFIASLAALVHLVAEWTQNRELSAALASAPVQLREAWSADWRAGIEPLAAARIFLKLVEKESPQLVILGKQGIDDDNNQTGQMLAALWNRPQATFASKVELDGAKAKVTREVDAGLETIEVDLPAVITSDLRLNEPRYVKLPDIMKAKKKQLDTIAIADLGVDAGAQFKTLKYEPPASRQKGVMVKDVGELVAALKQKGLL